MSSSDRPESWRTANQGSSSTHGSANQTPPLSSSFYNNSNNPLANNSSSTKKPTSYKKNVLRPVAVRERSKSVPGCKEIKNPKDPYSTTISFLLLPTTEGGEECKTQEKENKQPVRVNVFCDTGTIGTAKVIDGQVRQSFRRNVTSLDVLERLLRQPEGPVEINDQLIGVTDSEEEKEDTGAPNFKKGVELADVGLCILEGEREKLAKHLRHIDDESEKEAAEAQAAAQKEKAEQQQKQEEAVLQRKQEAANQKQQQQSNQSSSQKSSKSNEKQPSGEMQAQMLHKTMAESSSKKKSSNGDRVGRRRNKLNTLRKTRNLTSNGKKGMLPDSSHMMHRNSKRRGGKQPSSSSTADDSNRSTGKKQGRRAGRTPTKLASSKDAAGVSKPTDDNYPDTSSVNSSSEIDRKVTASSKMNMFKNCGYEFHFKLPAEVMNQVDQCLRDIAKMNKVVRGVATNGRGTVFLYGNGGVAYTPSIPKALYQKLRQLRSSSFSSRPCFVSLGTRDRYFVAFNDGSGDWKGSSALDKMLKKRVLRNLTGGNTSGGPKNGSDAFSNLPRSVSFGATYDTFFVVFNDGSWEYQGRAVPKSLEKKLRERDDAADLVLCNLGPNGEWFLKVESGKMWWSGISPELDAVLKKITKKGFLHNMDFGENGSYFVSYDEE